MITRWFVVVVLLCLVSVLVLSCGIPQETFDAVVAERDNVFAENTALLENNTSLQIMLEEVQSDLAKLQAGYDTLESDYGKLGADYNELKAEHDAVKADYSILEAEYHTLKTDYDALQTSYDKLKADHEATEQELVEIEEAPQSIELINRHYVWAHGEKEWTWDIKIPQALYDYYQQLPRPPTKNYSIYVTHPMDDIYLDALVERINNASQQAGYSKFQTVIFAIAFVQSLTYTADSVTTPYDEYPRYPIETLVDNGGDCEDTSILMASLLNSMGYGVVLILLPDHTAVGLLGGEGMYGTYWKYNGEKYYYLETTGLGWEVGEIPEKYEGTPAEIYSMIPTPILTHSWVATSKGTTAILEVTVENLGSAIAHDFYVRAGFDAGEKMQWNAQESRPLRLPIDESITVRLVLNIPLHKHTRFVVQIVDDGYAVETSYSKWFDT